MHMLSYFLGLSKTTGENVKGSGNVLKFAPEKLENSGNFFESVLRTLLHLKKAFDSIDRDIFASQLTEVGVIGKAHS